jgi:enoyl-CoA hydratase/carnithine racemase
VDEPEVTEDGPSQVQYARRGTAGWITFSRPDKRNALTPVMVRELNDAFDRVDADRELRAVVITGAGTAFCAGADLGYFLTMVDAADGCHRFMADLLHPLHRFLSRLRSSPLPVIAAVNGPCAAGGLETVLCCDLVVADHAATFSDAHSRRGLAPALGGVGNLVRALGVHRAKKVLLLAETYDAKTLASWGLVHAVAAQGRLDVEVAELVRTLTERSPASIDVMKRMVRRSGEPDWETQVAADLQDFRELWRSPDLREGLRAYVDHGEPAFRR